MWDFLRAKYYGDRSMGLVDETYMSLEVPSNTPDPAATPLTLHFADDPAARVKRVRVFVDNNPSPLVATFELGDPPVTQIDLHVRIDRFTSVRAVAERADGGLEMRSAWVKASGGCSAPPSAAAGGTLGEVRLQPSGHFGLGKGHDKSLPCRNSLLVIRLSQLVAIGVRRILPPSLDGSGSGPAIS